MVDGDDKRGVVVDLIYIRRRGLATLKIFTKLLLRKTSEVRGSSTVRPILLCEAARQFGKQSCEVLQPNNIAYICDLAKILMRLVTVAMCLVHRLSFPPRGKD